MNVIHFSLLCLWFYSPPPCLWKRRNLLFALQPHCPPCHSASSWTLLWHLETSQAPSLLSVFSLIPSAPDTCPSLLPARCIPVSFRLSPAFGLLFCRLRLQGPTRITSLEHINGQGIARLRDFSGSLMRTKSSPNPVEALGPPVLWCWSRFPSSSLPAPTLLVFWLIWAACSWMDSASVLPLCAFAFILQRLSSSSVFSTEPFRIHWYFYRILFIALFWHWAHFALIHDFQVSPKRCFRLKERPMKFERLQVYRAALPTASAPAEGTADYQKHRKEKKLLNLVYSSVFPTYLS